MSKEQVIKGQASRKESKVWVEGGEMVYIKISEVVIEEDVDRLIKETKRVLKQLSGQGKILVDLRAIRNTLGIRSSRFRKKTAGQIKDLITDPGFKRAALFGGNTMHRTIASFILAASGIKNIKILKDKEGALKWLKEP